MNLLRAEGLPGLTTYFRHPLYQGMWCFAGQLLAWPLWRLEQRGALGSHEDAAATLDGKAEPPVSGRRPRCSAGCRRFDVLGTVLNNAGLILTDVSVYQMLRGSVILFTALASRALFRRPFTEVDLQGLGLVGVGILCIGLANTIFWDYSAHHGHMAMRRGEYGAPWPAMGNFLIILSQALMAGLFIAEELLLKERHLPPLRLVAWGGLSWASRSTPPSSSSRCCSRASTPARSRTRCARRSSSSTRRSSSGGLGDGALAPRVQPRRRVHHQVPDGDPPRARRRDAAGARLGARARRRVGGVQPTELLGYALLLLGTLQYSGVVELPLIHAWLRRKGYAPI